MFEHTSEEVPVSERPLSELARQIAAGAVRVARALRVLPVLSAAFAEGRLSYSKVRALTRVAKPATEAALLEFALEATASQVERTVRQWRRGGAHDRRGD